MEHEQTPPPFAQLLELTYTSFVLARALYAFAKLGIADHLKDATMGSEELAAAAGVDARSLYRLLRTLSTRDVVSETSDHRFSLGALGQALRTDAPQSMRGWVVFSGEPMILRAWEDVVHSIRTGKPAWDHAHGMPVFDYLERNPEAAKTFDAAMTSLSAGEASAIVGAYDFARFRKIADIGGGQGLLLRAILSANPSVSGLLVDLAHAVEGVKEKLVEEGLSERCEVMAQSFFESVPPGADLYVFKYVIHDWDDERALAILQNCRKAMSDDATLLLAETVVPPPGEPHYAKLQDLEMLVLAGAQERTLEEYTTLLERAGYRLARVVPTGEPVSLIEATPR